MSMAGTFVAAGSVAFADAHPEPANGTGSAMGVQAVHPRTLSLGTQSTEVLTLQANLATLHYLPETVQRLKDGRFLFSPRYPNTPDSLQALWQVGVYNTMTEGAVYTFEAANHLSRDGIAGPQVQNAIADDLKHHRVNPYGYSYVYVSEHEPEELTLWHNGKVMLRTFVNTGIPQAPTETGTFPIYLRYYAQTMSGIMPDGTTYRDPGVPFVNYFNGGDAIHGFQRSRYGFAQSLGCVELPIKQAKIAWTWLHYGTLVTVASAPWPGTEHR